MEIRFKVNVESRDYRQFSLYHLFTRQRIKTIFLLLILAVYLRSFFWVLHDSSAIVILVFIVLVTALAVVILAKRAKNSRLRISEADSVLDGDGLHQTHSLGNTNLPYDVFFLICETKNTFYLYIARKQAIIIPKRCLENPRDVETVRTLFREHIIAKKLRLRND